MWELSELWVEMKLLGALREIFEDLGCNFFFFGYHISPLKRLLNLGVLDEESGMNYPLPLGAALHDKLERVRAVEVAAGLVASIAGAVALLGDDQLRDLSIIGALGSGAVLVFAYYFRRKLKGAMGSSFEGS